MAVIVPLQFDRYHVADPHQAHTTIFSEKPENLTPRVLELTSTLQTTLEIEDQIELFAAGVRRHIEFDGMEYRRINHNPIKIGHDALHRATYDLKLENETLGSILVYRDLPFSEDDLEQLERLLCALIYPLRNALRYLQAVQSAYRDPLTEIHNRFAFDQALSREVELAHRNQLPLSVIVFDIDHFKKFNDSYGHSFGDQVLKAIAKTAESTVRRSDMIFRYGGEEFVVLARHTNCHGANLLAERIRHNIAALQTVGGRSIQLTISLGVSCVKPGESGKELFDRADSALYQAKNQGRNQTVITD